MKGEGGLAGTGRQRYEFGLLKAEHIGWAHVGHEGESGGKNSS